MAFGELVALGTLSLELLRVPLVRTAFCIILALLVLYPIGGHAESRDKQTGLKFAEESEYLSLNPAIAPLNGELPSEVDLSPDMPPPGDQGQQSSCVGWATAYALKTYQEQRERHWGVRDDRGHQFSPAWIYNQIATGGAGCRGGSSYLDALRLLRTQGAAVLEDFPYSEENCTTQPSDLVKQHAKEFSIASFNRVNVQDEQEVKAQLAAGFPVLIGMVVDQGFVNLKGSETYRSSSGERLGGHAMVVVGYSDARTAFKIINSWGAQWGDAGYGWIGYDQFRHAVREAYVVQDHILDPHRPPSKPTPWPEPQPFGPEPVPSFGPKPPREGPPAVILGQPTVQFDPSGVLIRPMGVVKGCMGCTVQFVARFHFRQGPPLRATPFETRFRDSDGLVAVGTPPSTVGSNDVRLDANDIRFSIPYMNLNLPFTAATTRYPLAVVVSAYVNGSLVTQSPEAYFDVQW